MKKIQLLTLIPGLLLGALLLGSCSVAKVSAEELQRTKSLAPAEGKALVYIVRPATVGAVINFHVSCDGKPIGTTSGKRFIYAQLEPGLHTFLAVAENKEEIFLELEAGKTYYLEQEVKMGLIMARTKWKKLTEADGKKKLAKCKLSGDCSTCI